MSGTVTYNGEKVKGGTLIFSPSSEAQNPGPPAAATIKEDGTFTLDTGGAVVGKTTIAYTSPGGAESKDPKKEGEVSPYNGLVPKDTTVEIKSGSNNLKIELVKGK